jgi:hypothetical protein
MKEKFMTIKSERQTNFFGICSRCKGNCCRNARPPTTLKRKKIIEEYLKKQKIPIKNPFSQTTYIFPRENQEGYCVFYDKESRKCLVHPVKPETCIAGPITFDINMQNRKIEWYLKTQKICPLAGALHKNKELLEKHLKSTKKEILRLISELDPEALKTILKIEESETFKIEENDVEKMVLEKLK